MQHNIERVQKPLSKKWIGVFLIMAGVLLTANRLNAGIPDWLVGTPAAMIATGLIIGLYNRFRVLYWAIPVFWGAFLMLAQAMPELDLHKYTAAISFIAIGIIFIALHRIPAWHAKHNLAYGKNADNVTTIFGHIKRTIHANDYTGSSMVCIMGNTEINFNAAFINETAELDITIVMGAATLAIPEHWIIKNEMAAVLGVVADKRPAPLTGLLPASKTLVLKGAVILGNIDITTRL